MVNPYVRVVLGILRLPDCLEQINRQATLLQKFSSLLGCKVGGVAPVLCDLTPLVFAFLCLFNAPIHDLGQLVHRCLWNKLTGPNRDEQGH